MFSILTMNLKEDNQHELIGTFDFTEDADRSIYIEQPLSILSLEEKTFIVEQYYNDMSQKDIALKYRLK